MKYEYEMIMIMNCNYGIELIKLDLIHFLNVERLTKCLN